MTLTLANLPDELNDALHEKARVEGKSVDQVAVEAIHTGLGLAGPGKRRNLSDFAGSLSADDAAVIEATVREMDNTDLRSWGEQEP